MAGLLDFLRRIAPGDAPVDPMAGSVMSRGYIPETSGKQLPLGGIRGLLDVSPVGLADAATQAINRANVPSLVALRAVTGKQTAPGDAMVGLLGQGGGAGYDAARSATQAVVPMMGLLGNQARGALPAGYARDQSGAIVWQGSPSLGALPFVPSGAGRIINRAPGKEAFDARFGKTFMGGDPRKSDVERNAALTTKVEKFGDTTGDFIDLGRYVGHPYIIGMSDRTDAGGLLRAVNNVELNNPVPLWGGQGYMFNNPGRAWASNPAPVSTIFNLANDLKAQTGKDPLFIPWRMSPTGSDFAAMSGETMLSYADAALSKGVKKAIDRDIGKQIPGWKGMADPESIAQFRTAPTETRRAIMDMLDKKYGPEGMLTPGQARLAVADPKQLAGFDGQVMNVGMIDVAAGPLRGGGAHPYYKDGIPGRALGTFAGEHNAAELLPALTGVKGVADPRNPPRNVLRAMETAPRGGILTPGLLKTLGY